jgi:hypothetical protein
MSPARAALEKLLRRGERARSRGASERASLALTPATYPEYGALATLADVEAFHAEIALAERAGAVTAERTRTGGALQRLWLADLDRLGRHLDIDLLSDRAQAAADALAPWTADYPVVARLTAAWTEGRKVRGTGPEAARDVLDAIAVVEARSDDAQERILRRESIRLLGDSKRLERLTPWLDLLTCDELAASGLDEEDIWASLGLRREPQPMLVAGCGMVRLHDATLPLCRPYLGLPVDAVQTIETSARYLLTIENLASFHDAARALPDADGLLVYTAGMPSPAWRALYARVLAALPAHAAVWHWGDIDEGGFRIAATLAATANETGRRLRPWLMSPSALPADIVQAAAPSPAQLAQMLRWARKAGWDEVAVELERAPLRLEQEAVDPRFPGGDVA